MQTKNVICALAIFSAVLLGACVDQDDFDLNRLSETTVNPALEANLITMDFTAGDFLDQISDPDNGIELWVGENKTLHLRYTKDFSLDGATLADDYFNKFFVIDLCNVESGAIPIVNPLGSGTVFDDDIIISQNGHADIPIPEFEKYDEDEQPRVIESIQMLTGALKFMVNSELPADIEIQVSSDSIINVSTGQPLQQVLTFATGSSESSLNLAGYRLNLRSNSDNTSAIPFTYTLIGRTKGKNVDDGNYQIAVNLVGQNLNIEAAWGRVGNPTIPVTGTLDINFFQDSTVRSNSIDIKEVNVNFDITNYTGIKLSLDLSDLLTKTHTGHIEKLLSGNSQKIFSIQDALMYSQPKVTSFTISPNTSAIETLPNLFQYDMQIQFGDGLENSFIYPNGKYVDIHSVVDVPIVLSVDSFVTAKETGTLSFLQENDGIGDYIDSAMLKLTLENTFPADLMLELYSYTGAVMLPLLDEAVRVEPAEVTLNNEGVGVVSAATNQKVNVNISKDRYEQLKNADKIIFKLTLNTPTVGSQKPPVVFSSDSKLKIKLGVKANGKLTF